MPKMSKPDGIGLSIFLILFFNASAVKISPKLTQKMNAPGVSDPQALMKQKEQHEDSENVAFTGMSRNFSNAKPTTRAFIDETDTPFEDRTRWCCKGCTLGGLRSWCTSSGKVEKPSTEVIMDFKPGQGGMISIAWNEKGKADILYEFSLTEEEVNKIKTCPNKKWCKGPVPVLEKSKGKFKKRNFLFKNQNGNLRFKAKYVFNRDDPTTFRCTPSTSFEKSCFCPECKYSEEPEEGKEEGKEEAGKEGPTSDELEEGGEEGQKSKGHGSQNDNASQNMAVRTTMQASFYSLVFALATVVNPS